MVTIEENGKGAIIAAMSEFKGKQYVDIRKWYIDDAGELQRTRKGISLNREQFAALDAKWDEIRAMVEGAQS